MLPIIFEDRQFATVDHAGQRYVTAATLADLLGLSGADQVLQIRRRYPEEFTEGRAVEVPVKDRLGRNQVSVIYNPIGMLATATHTNTEVGSRARIYLLSLANREYQQSQIVQNTAASLYDVARPMCSHPNKTIYAEDIEKAAGLLIGQVTDEAWTILAVHLERLRPWAARMKFKTTGPATRFFQTMHPDVLARDKGATLEELMPESEAVAPSAKTRPDD